MIHASSLASPGLRWVEWKSFSGSGSAAMGAIFCAFGDNRQRFALVMPRMVSGVNRIGRVMPGAPRP